MLYEISRRGKAIVAVQSVKCSEVFSDSDKTCDFENLNFY